MSTDDGGGSSGRLTFSSAPSAVPSLAPFVGVPPRPGLRHAFALLQMGVGGALTGAPMHYHSASFSAAAADS